MTNTVKAKEQCLADFGAQCVWHKASHLTYDSSRGKQQTNFGVLVRGTGRFETADGVITLAPGEIIFLPEGARYRSSYEGDPDILYYCLHLTFRKDKNGVGLDQHYGIQKLPPLPDTDAGALFERIYRLLESDDAASRFAAFAEFYRFSGVAFAKMTPDRPAAVPELEVALRYIAEHFREDYTTADLARACRMSESRLYSLFREALGSTPVEYKNEQKILSSIDAIKTGYSSVDEISASLGFRSAAYFRRCFKKATGMTPTEYRKNYGTL